MLSMLANEKVKMRFGSEYGCFLSFPEVALVTKLEIEKLGKADEKKVGGGEGQVRSYGGCPRFGHGTAGSASLPVWLKIVRAGTLVLFSFCTILLLERSASVVFNSLSIYLPALTYLHGRDSCSAKLKGLQDIHLTWRQDITNN